MPRPPRDGSPGTFHVTVKALGGGAYYRDGLDRLVWRTILARTLVRMRDAWTCISFTQMTTHVHLLLDVSDASLSFGMQLLNGEYTRAANRRHSRRGPLLTRRFHAVRIANDGQLASAFRYDARNPVAAGISPSAEAWEHGSYRTAIGLEADGALTDASRVLALFGRDRATAVGSLRAFVAWPRA